jgi:CO dehydrogenase maturation factor
MGKGGSGKTTISSAFVKYLSEKDFVLAVDADVNVHMHKTLDMCKNDISKYESEIFNYFEGYRNVPILSTTPPTSKSRFIKISKTDKFLKKYATFKNNIALLTVGTYEESDLGSSCYHGKLGVIESIFHHMLDSKNQYVVSDFTAGTDSLGTSMFIISDLNIFVVEPTLKSIDVYRDFIEKSKNEGIKTYVVLNKITDDEDINFCHSHIEKERIIGEVHTSKELRSFERGNLNEFDLFVRNNKQLFAKIKTVLDKQERNWDDYYQKVVKIFNQSCQTWYNDFYSKKINENIDTNFSYEKQFTK